MRNEKDIQGRFGTGRHFTVPEDYFSNFTDRMMAQLPEREARVVELPRSRWSRLRSMGVAAAVASFVMVGAGVWLSGDSARQADSSLLENHATAQFSSELDQAVDYVMLDTDDMYAFMAGE